MAMGAMALGVYASSLRGMSPVHPRYSFPWWVLAALFFLAEMAVVHLPLGRQTLTFTLTEIPLTLGLFLTTPADLLLAQLIGAGVALAVHRGLGPAKLAFNLSHYMLGSTVAISVFRVLVAPGAVGEMTWLAAYLATGAMTVVSAIAISAGMSIVEGRPQGEVLTKGIAFGLVSALLNTSAGLIGVLLLEVAPHALLLMTVPSAILFAAYRSLAAHRRGERRTRILNVCMSAIHRDADADSVIRSLVSSLRENFGAELAEIVLFSERRWGIRSILRPDGDRPVLERTEPTPSEGALRDLAEPVMLVAERPLEEPLRSWMTERALREALATPVLGRDGRSLGCIVVADRLSDREGFAAGDLEVVQVLAGQVGLVIERAGLVARLRRSLSEVDRFASIVRSSRDAIIGLTPEGAIATWNPAAEHLMRLAEREAIGRQPDIFLPPDERAAFRTQLAKVLDGVELEEEAGHVLSGGEPVPVSLLMSPITDTRGRAIGASLIIRDERDRRRREQTLRRSE